MVAAGKYFQNLPVTFDTGNSCGLNGTKTVQHSRRCGGEDGMRIGALGKKAIVVFAILLVYIVTLVMGSTEAHRRSLQLSSESADPDHVTLIVVVTGVDQMAQQLTTQLNFRLAGKIASDEVTPAVDLKFFVNNVRGEQEFDFRKGRRINPVEVVFPLNGNLNRYPFDRYRTTLSLLTTRPVERGEDRTPEQSGDQGAAGQAKDVPFGALALEKTSPVALSVALIAAVPGTKFMGNIDRKESTQLTAINLNLRRADNLIIVSILINAMMVSLAVALLLIVLRLIGAPREQASFTPLTMSFALIFGLPALRNAQPGVPPIGAFCDYISFIWAELIVAVSGLLFAWRWLRTTKRRASE